MSARLVLAVALTTLIVVPGVAAAKEVQQAQVCGADRCFTFDRANSGNKLRFFDTADWPALTAPQAAPWYRLRITVAAPDVRRFSFTNAYVPSADRIRQRGPGGGVQWVAVPTDLRPVLRNVSADLTPLPASTLRGAGQPAPPMPAAAPPGNGSPRLALALAALALAAVLLGVGYRRRRASLARARLSRAHPDLTAPQRGRNEARARGVVGG